MNPRLPGMTSIYWKGETMLAIESARIAQEIYRILGIQTWLHTTNAQGQVSKRQSARKAERRH